MTLYLIRVIQYHWDPLKENVHQRPIISKSISLTKEPTLEELKRVLDLLSTELSTLRADAR